MWGNGDSICWGQWRGTDKWLHTVRDGDSLPAGRNCSFYIGMKIICGKERSPEVKKVVFGQGEEFDSHSFCAWINLIFN